MSLTFTRAVAKARGLSAKAHALLRVLADRADAKGRSFARQETLAYEMGVSKRTVMRAFAELEASGWISRERRHRRDGTRTSDLVTVYDMEAAAKRAEAMLRLPLMVAIAGGRACGEAVDTSGDKARDKVTTCHLGQGDNLSPQEPITYSDSLTDHSRRARAEQTPAQQGAEVPGHRGAGTPAGPPDRDRIALEQALDALALGLQRKRA